MPSLRADGPPPRERSLEERVLECLGRESGRLSFNGLRRALGAHPESLTRVLRRLERGGAVVRDGRGYELADGFHEALGKPPERVFKTVASVELARGVEREEVLGRLAGRWFGRLRFVGVYEGETDPWLVWSIPGLEGRVLLSVHGRTLRVGVDPHGPDAEELLEEHARELLLRGLERLPRGAVPRAPTAALAAAPRPARWAS